MGLILSNLLNNLANTNMRAYHYNLLISIDIFVII